MLKKNEGVYMLEVIIAMISYLLGASSMYIFLNHQSIKNKIQIRGNQNHVINGVNNEKK